MKVWRNFGVAIARARARVDWPLVILCAVIVLATAAVIAVRVLLHTGGM